MLQDSSGGAGELASSVERQLAYLQKRLNAARHRAAKKGWPFTITVDDLRRMLTDQKCRCELSGIDFSFQRFENALVKCPLTPSIDRKDSRDGYTPSNIRLVCTAVNFGMGEWGDEVLRKIAKGVVEQVSVSAPEGDNWFDRQRGKIAAAEQIARGLKGKNLDEQKRRIAALKRALTLGPAGLSSAAHRAHRTQEQRRRGRSSE